MENRLTLSSLSNLLAETTGRSRKSCDDFLREFFKLAGDILASGENLRIKGFGSFKISEVESRASINVSTGKPNEIAAHRKVVFTPAKELAAIINEPFEIFGTVEVDEDFPLEDLEEDLPELEEIPGQEPELSVEENSVATNENAIEKSIIEAGSDEEEIDDDITYEAYNNFMNTNNNNQPAPLQPEPEKIYVQTPGLFGKGYLLGFLSALVICLFVFILGCFLNWWPTNMSRPGSVPPPPAPVTVVEETPEPLTQEIPEVIEEQESNVAPAEKEPLKVEPNKVYDKVTTTRYLTTIARDHYGDFNFWPYIYLENQSFLGHPDRVTPGTRVVVPPLSKYGINPANRQDLEKAKMKAQEIYSRFR